MFRHVGFQKWKPGTTQEEIDRVTEAASKVADAVPQVRSYSYGPNIGTSFDSQTTWDYIIVADFDSEAAWQEYRPHPAHRAVSATLAPIRESLAILQYELP